MEHVMSSRVPALKEHLGYRLRQASNYVSHDFARKLAIKGVTVSEWGLMRGLYGRKPAPATHVAEEMGMTCGAITKLTDRLIAKNLMRRESDPHYGRAQTLRLTAKGARLLPELAALVDASEAECFAHLSARERLDLMRMLRDTVVHLGPTTMSID
jgi:DNA-binding MarR family transcriptional regulator